MTGDSRARELDERAGAMAEASVFVAALTRGLARIEAAWPGSVTGRAAARLAALQPAARLRFWSTLAAAAAATALALTVSASAPAPLAWITPVVAGVLALLVWFGLPAADDDSGRS